MSVILDAQAPPAPGDWDGFLERLHAIEAQALQVAAERDSARGEAHVQTLRGDALERELRLVTDELRVAINASAYWKARAEQAETELHDRPTVELPRVQPEPEPVRRRTGSRARKGKRR